MNMDQCKNPIIAFLWRPEEMTPEVIDMARRTGTRAIFDLTGRGVIDASYGLLATADEMGISDIMVPPSLLEEDRFQEILVAEGIENIWVDIHPRFCNGNLPTLLNALERIPDPCRSFPVMGHMPWLREILDRDPKISNLVLKGNEASGFVSSEALLTLYATIQNIMQDRGMTTNLFIWGGIGTPEAAGAFLSAGAAGIVFESLHWLTDLVCTDDGVRERIGKLRPEQTELVGGAQGTPCRLYNKGNSLAIKELAAFEKEGELKAGESVDRAFARKIQTSAVHPLDSRFSARELIPLGVEAGFAASFVERYGSGTEQAMRDFVSDVTDHVVPGNREASPCEDHPTAREMGTTYPFIQGAMSWITDMPRFAKIISDAGALPTVALGLLHGRDLEQKLGKLSQVMDGRPCAVNFIALPENPHKEEQLAWIKEQKPRFAVIAAGDPSHARELLQWGIEAIYVAPDAAMLKLAFDAGIRYVICEGHEAGGHVGRNSTTTLAQMIHDLKRRDPSLFLDRKVILAGGIFNRTTALIAARLGADVIQVGTAYLATEEIVETGALTRLYQQMVLKSKPGETVISGGRQGLGIRALKTPKTIKIQTLERELHGKGQNEENIRKELESISVGSLLIAARGLKEVGGTSLDEETCVREGHFMSGACAGAIHKSYSVVELHRELAKGFCENGRATGERFWEKWKGLAASGVFRSGKYEDRVAVTGRSIFNSLGNSPEAVWKANIAMKSGIGFVPPSKWDHSLYYDPHPQTPDKTYCRVGAFANLSVSRKQLGIAPHDFETMAGATKMTLWLAQEAVRESGIRDSNIPRERIGVFISQNSGEAAGTLTDLFIRGNVHQILEAVKRVVHLTPEMEKDVIEEIKAGYRPTDDTTLLGRLNCAAAGFICVKYGIQGPAFSLSAACATSLAAIYTAVQMIRNGVIDAALVGGAEEPLLPLHFVEFSALGVLAGSKGTERVPSDFGRPFAMERDGMVLGEGGGMVVLERESTARKRGAVIHGFVTGVGAGNSHLGLVESSRATQAAAIRASFKDAGYGPEAVDLVECHATGTVQGDVEEVQALKTFYNTDNPTVITSFKSQIGHTLGASGINSLIRGLLAMSAGILPPSINCTRPDPALGIEGSCLRIPTEPLEWKPGKGGPRRVQVNAFGFGGSNYVVQMEQCANGAGEKTVAPREISFPTPEKTADLSILMGVSFFRTRMGDQDCRLAVLAGSGDEARFKLKDLQQDFRLPLAVKQEKKLARKGIFLSDEKDTPPAMAFIFPGQGSHYPGMGRDLYGKFPLIRKRLDRAASLADFDLLRLLFQGTEEDLKKTWLQQPALFALECAIAEQLMAWGVHPLAVAGHSVGEMAALWAARVYSFEDGFRLVNERARCMKIASGLHKDTGMMAVHAGLNSVDSAVSRQKGVVVANINAPNQVVLSGHMEALSAMGRELKRLGYRFTFLKVEMAFHSPMMKSVREAFAASITAIPLHAPRIPVISNTSGRPFPSHESRIREMIVSQLELPVCWLADMEAMQNDYNIRCFVEIGPKKILTNLLSDTFEEGMGIPTCLPSGEEKAFQAAMARLFVKGNLKLSKPPQFMPLKASPSSMRDQPKGVESPLMPAGSTGKEVAEAVMGIIMEATGYERDEIDEHMDLRDDLAIRSSRLPIILDGMERRFGITIDLTDFIHLRTIDQISKRVAQMVSKGPAVPPENKETPLPVREDIKRILFSKTPLAEGTPRTFSFNAGASVCILSMAKRGRLYDRMEKSFQREWGLSTTFQKLPAGLGGLRSRWREGKRTAKAIGRLKSIPSLAGMIMDIRGFPQEQHGSMDGAALLLEQVFSMVKVAMESPNLAFVLLLHDSPEEGAGGVLAEGILGMFLCCVHEYSSVAFRAVGLDRGTDPETAVRKALKEHAPVVERIHDNDAAFTMEGFSAPIVYRRSSEMGLAGKEVVVFSGGGSGITARLARSLIPLGARVVLLGRTKVDADRDFKGLLAKGVSEDDAFRRWISEKHPDISPEALGKEMIRLQKALEVVRALEDLHGRGMEASYYTCDVTRPGEVETVFETVMKQYGRIDGIVHGAGILRDGWMRDMTTDDFSSVVPVKLSGAQNLFQAAKDRGIRFFTCLSSVVSILGNPGQVNYAAANRMMSALMHALKRENPSIRFKSLILPPIEGVGMAENVWIRKIMRERNIGYIHVDELTALFLRELCFDFSGPSRVMFMRSLPHMDSVRLNGALPSPGPAKISAAGLVFNGSDFPLIDSVSQVDLRRGSLIAHRAFSHEKDAWLNDHRPVKSMKHPVVSGIMLIETLMEAARMLYPYLRPRKILNAWFLDMIQCSLGAVRPSTIFCRRVGSKNGKITCVVSLETGSGPFGNPGKNEGVVCRAEVVLGHGDEMPGEASDRVQVQNDEWDTPRVDVDGFIDHYERHSDLQGRYRMAMSLYGTGPEVVGARMAYGEGNDFFHLENTHYQYSPYLLEMLFHLPRFHGVVRDAAGSGSLVPVGIEEMVWVRKCREGENVSSFARMKSKTRDGSLWDITALDENGEPLMLVKGLSMQKVPE